MKIYNKMDVHQPEVTKLCNGSNGHGRARKRNKMSCLDPIK